MNRDHNSLVPIPSLHDCRTNFISYGIFIRKHDGAKVKRYRCQSCKKTFSDSSSRDTCWQKKPYINEKLVDLLCGGVSQRRTAFILNVNRKTIVRKFILMGRRAKQILPRLNAFYPKIKHLEFDDLETFEHTKCKPLSVTLAVEHETRWIIGIRVSSMNAKGKLTKLALKKYGRRMDTRSQSRKELFTEMKEFVHANADIQSDMNPHYATDVMTHFENCKYQTHRSRRACVTGQGELKKGGHDPLFSLNHTCAMLRANINRLVRKTWCTTKRPERLEYHIALYAIYHNLLLIDLGKKTRPLNSLVA